MCETSEVYCFSDNSPAQFIASQGGQDFGGYVFGGAGLGFGRLGADMGGGDQVGMGDQRRGSWGLLREHIEGGAGDVPGLEGGQ